VSTVNSESVGIFISYRRDDTAYPSGWLFDRLASRFPHGQVFKDIDSIALGDDFVAAVTAAIDNCAVLVAVIGAKWLTVTGEDGSRRIDDPADFVHFEIATALKRNVPVIPVLVDGARIPSATELPTDLTDLRVRQNLDLRPESFTSDTDRLIKRVEVAIDDRIRGITSRSPAQQSINRAIRGPDLRPYTGVAKTTEEHTLTVTALETSLAYQGHRAALDRTAYTKELRVRATVPENEAGQFGYTHPQMIEAIKKVGVPTDPAGRLFRAQVTNVKSSKGIVVQLARGRPVVAGGIVREAWLDRHVQSAGRIPEADGELLGGKTLLILGWDPDQREFAILMAWPEWGDEGRGWLPDRPRLIGDYLHQASAIAAYEVDPKNAAG
jgi:hypothetical protein